MSLCVVNPSAGTKPGNAFIQMIDEPMVKHKYSFKAGRFMSPQSIILSDREKQVIKLSANGYSVPDIASILFVSVNTVKYHKKNIYKKLGVNNISEAIFFALSNEFRSSIQDVER